MKKGFFAVLFIVVAGYFSFAASPITIVLRTPFRLNPILGIRGDDKEASSKFIQRLIFSPLVFPVQDPYLQDDFDYSPDHSIIDKLEYYSGSGWNDFILNDPMANPLSSANKFRVHLRENLYFREDGFRKNDATLLVTGEDVIYSYRLARITSDRVYFRYINTRENDRGVLNLNSLLYSRLRSFVDVYLEENNAEYIYFDMDKPYTCIQFIKSLAYVPILSATQLRASESVKRNPTHDEYKSLHGRLNLSELQNGNRFNSQEYNMYDFAAIERTSRGQRFYENPRGYGQYFVEKRSAGIAGGGGSDPGLFTSCNFIKNDEWCNFGNQTKKVGTLESGTTIDHEEYRAGAERILVDATRDYDIKERMINNLEPADVLYNIPLSANMFDTTEQERGLSFRSGKKAMQISHFLYGIYFGPDLDNPREPLNRNVRDFFSFFADRPRLSNIINYMAGTVEYTNFASVINETVAEDGQSVFLGHLQIQRLYYPFYMGATEQSTSEDSAISKYYRELEDNDYYQREYLSSLGGNTLNQYFAQEGSKSRFFDQFVGGTGLPEQVKRELNDKLGSVMPHIVRRNSLKIIIYYIEGDHPGRQIAGHFRDVVNKYFRENNIAPVIDIQAREIAEYGEWKTAAERNARNGTVSFLVRGWNYRFDMMDELAGTYIEAAALREIRGEYERMINSDQSGRLSVDGLVYNIARRFVNNSMIIPLVGLQNYSVYSSEDKDPKGIAASFETYKDIEILLLPYYWRKK